MKRLSGTDSLFLSIEVPNWHQHVGGLTILDTSQAPDFDFLTVRDQLMHRLALAPKFMWKLHEVPLRLDRPMWVDDEDFDIDRHLHHVAVPAPGGMEELALITGKILSRQLDRRYPLWEAWYIEGLPNDRVAMVMKYHHCLLDGMAGASLASVLLDFTADAEPPEIPPDHEIERAGPPPTNATLLAGAAASVAMTPVRSVSYVARTAKRGITMMSMARSGTGIVPIQVPSTSFNGRVGPKRRLGFSSVAMDDVRAVKEHFGVKVNDVVLALVAGALRSYLEERGELPDRPLVTGVPLSTRACRRRGERQLDRHDGGVAGHRRRRSRRAADDHPRQQPGRQGDDRGGAGDGDPVVRGGRAAGRAQHDHRGTGAHRARVPHADRVEHPRLERARAAVPALHLRGAGHRHLLHQRDHGDDGAERDAVQLHGPARLRFPRRPRPRSTTRGPSPRRLPDALAELMASAGLGSPTPVEDPLGFTPERP